MEIHHIIPKSFGGGDDPSNLVKLTPREHYVAHKLLVRFTEGVLKAKMINAWFRMSCQRHDPQFSFISSRQFDEARNSFGRVAGWATRGKTYEEIYGIERAAELKRHRANKKSEERKGKTWEDIYGPEKAAAMRSSRGKQAILWNTGRKHSEDTRQRISAAARKRVYVRVSCTCGRSVSTHNLAKHRSSCKTANEGKDI